MSFIYKNKWQSGRGFEVYELFQDRKLAAPFQDESLFIFIFIFRKFIFFL